MTNKTRTKKELSKLKLGSKLTEYKSDYDPNLLEVIKNNNPKSDSWISFICTEFTSLCPKTNQPDFAKIFINYIADKNIIESKSMKLYLFSFRNHGSFHEDCIEQIKDDLISILKPKYLEVIGEFTPRGGISIFPYSSYSNNLKKFQALKKFRQNNYSPGKYSMALSRIY